ncbi:MAG TPA: sigma-70 family RNA polymerase sigma factor [Bryobacteraceae bacterium]|jgi:RNA polymerase sigma-70 factor (ECF subfamily)|nr:sigma-70 family RNA polymerase sigma factor [Bryobacteraceae bacterium]
MEGIVVQDSNVTNRAEEDAELAQRLKNRDPRAMAELYDRYGRLAWFLIYRIVGNESAAEDMVQETFLRVWNGMHNFDWERGPLGRWVLSVARNRAIDYLRSWEGRMDRGAFPIHEWDQPVAAGDFENDLLNADLVGALREAMTKLTERQQAILNLAYVEGLTQMEMAKRLKRPLGTIKTWVRAALQALRSEMEPYLERAV